ncbi:metallophosphoesterase family protein [soil metagenome]
MSRIAFISDVHSNIDALETVFADIDSQGVEKIVCLGDVVGYGAEPAACVRRVFERCTVTVLGNHEAMLGILHTINDWELGATVRVPLHLAKEQLTKAEFDAVCDLPLVADLAPLVAVHSSLDDPAAFHYIDDLDRAARNFATQQRWHVAFHGHTHYPLIWEKRGSTTIMHPPSESPVRLSPDSKYTINVGSVGQPRDEDPRACYAIYDPEEHLFLHRRVAYDIQMARTRIVRAKLPANNGLRLILGR